MNIIRNYRHNDALRRSFNALAQKTFGLNFENWYQNGFWGDDYNPYSAVIDGEVVANVSLNRTDMVVNGQRKRLYQLGTVMTDPAYRSRGFIRAIMAEIEKDTAGADGVYLFANDSVVEFYPKFGFRPEKEYICTKAVDKSGPCRMTRVPMDGPEGWEKLKKAMEESTFPGVCYMVDNPGLIFFYVSQFMRDCVFYDETLNAWAIAEIENGELFLHNIFAPDTVSLDAVIEAFGDVKTVTLGFSPADSDGFTCREYREEDCTFFVKGEAFRDLTEQKLRIPTLSHA